MCEPSLLPPRKLQLAAEPGLDARHSDRQCGHPGLHLHCQRHAGPSQCEFFYDQSLLRLLYLEESESKGQTLTCFLCLITHLTEWLPLHNVLIFLESSCCLGQHTQDGLLLFGLEFEHAPLCLLNDGRGWPAWRAKSALGNSDPQRSPRVGPMSPPGHLCEGCQLGEFPWICSLDPFVKPRQSPWICFPHGVILRRGERPTQTWDSWMFLSAQRCGMVWDAGHAASPCGVDIA